MLHGSLFSSPWFELSSKSFISVTDLEKKKTVEPCFNIIKKILGWHINCNFPWNEYFDDTLPWGHYNKKGLPSLRHHLLTLKASSTINTNMVGCEEKKLDLEYIYKFVVQSRWSVSLILQKNNSFYIFVHPF